MAGNAVIGALRVVLGIDTASLDKGLKDSQSGLASFAKQVSAIAGGISLEKALEGMVAAMVGAIKHAFLAGEELNKLSQSAGVTVEEFAKLKYAAELSDVSTESLGKSMGKLSKAMVAAATEGASPAAQAFTAMGIAVKNQDGTLRSGSDVLKDIAEKFTGYKDGAEKTALAVALFGKAGAGMIPLLNQGRDGLQEAGDEAEKFGLVLDKKTTMAAEAFNDNLKRMDAIKNGLYMTIAARLLPTFEMLSEQMLDLKKNSDFTNAAADAVTATLRFLTGEVLSAVAAFRGLKNELTALWNVLTVPVKDIIPAWRAFIAAGDETSKSLAAVGSTMDRVFSKKPEDNATTWTMQAFAVKALNREVTEYGKAWSQTAAPIISAADATKNALQMFLDSQAKRIASHEAEAATIGKSVGEQAKLRLEYEAQAIALAKGIALGPAQLALISAAGDAAAAAAMKVEAANITMQAMNPAQKFAQDMAQLQTVYQNTNMTMETFAARQQQIAEAAGATWGQASASIAGSFATISSSFSKESSAMATAAKVFGVIQGTISMFTGAAKALELPFPANIAAVAAVLAKGASLVASIKSQSVPTGMMTGGAMTVKGGGGPDSVPVSLMASPGEQIDIWRPDQGGGADPRRGGAGGGNTFNIGVPIATTRQAIENLFDLINDAIGDGHRFKVVPA
jgi:hypothetical protein